MHVCGYIRAHTSLDLGINVHMYFNVVQVRFSKLYFYFMIKGKKEILLKLKLLSAVDRIFNVFQDSWSEGFSPFWCDVEGKEAKRDGARGRCQVIGRMARNGIVELQSPTLLYSCQGFQWMFSLFHIFPCHLMTSPKQRNQQVMNLNF